MSVYYNYFANGWLKDVRRNSQTGSLVASYSYDPVGVRTRVNLGNSTWQTFGYDTDPRYRLDNIHYAYNCGSGIADQGGLSFTRDKTGNPTAWGDIAGLYGRVYSYDKNSRLKSANLPGNPRVDYTYDWVGNRINPGAMQFNAADQITSWPGQHNYEYYGDGSLHYQKDAGGVVQKTYSYTPDGLLSSVVHAGAGTSSMTWDADGVTTTYTYDLVDDPEQDTMGIGNLLTVTRPGNNAATSITTTYYYGPYAQVKLGLPWSITDNLSHSVFFEYDARGNVISATDVLGNQTNFIYNIADQLSTAIYPSTAAP